MMGFGVVIEQSLRFEDELPHGECLRQAIKDSAV